MNRRQALIGAGAALILAGLSRSGMAAVPLDATEAEPLRVKFQRVREYMLEIPADIGYAQFDRQLCSKDIPESLMRTGFIRDFSYRESPWTSAGGHTFARLTLYPTRSSRPVQIGLRFDPV